MSKLSEQTIRKIIRAQNYNSIAIFFLSVAFILHALKG